VLSILLLLVEVLETVLLVVMMRVLAEAVLVDLDRDPIYL
jgi:hypothetical protein